MRVKSLPYFTTYKRKTHGFKKLLFVGLLTGALGTSACDSFKKENYDKLTDNLESLRSQVTDLASDPSKTADEIKKLRKFEYKVLDILETETPAEMERILNELGNEYWECFHIERHISPGPKNDPTEKRAVAFRVFCKRQPFTPLRFLVK